MGPGNGAHRHVDGLDAMKNATASSAITCTANTITLTPNSSETANVASSDAYALRFEVLLIEPVACHERIGGPNRGCSSSHVLKRADDLANANAATSMNGTVGRIGNATPIRPRPRLTNPSSSQKSRITI